MTPIVRHLAQIIAPLLVSCMAAEVTLRFVDAPWVRTSNAGGSAPWISTDTERGWKNRPGNYTIRFYNDDRDIDISIREDGARNFTQATFDHPHTLVLLGDSYVFGYGVGGDETVAATLASLLPEHSIENLGVAGYGTVNVVQQICPSGITGEKERSNVRVSPEFLSHRPKYRRLSSHQDAESHYPSDSCNCDHYLRRI